MSSVIYSPSSVAISLLLIGMTDVNGKVAGAFAVVLLVVSG